MLIKQAKEKVEKAFIQEGFDADWVAFSYLDFNQKQFQSFVLNKDGRSENVYFDLASLSKPLVLSLGSFIHKDKMNKNLELLLNHKAGLPAWGLLPKSGWREQIKSYPIQESECLYSDFSAIRFYLEMNEKLGHQLELDCSEIWDKQVLFWKDLPQDVLCPMNGYRSGREVRCEIHDPNAYNLNVFTPHAGLFGTIEGVSKTLLEFDQKFALLEKMKTDLLGHSGRFVNGWDTVTDKANTLAGKGADELTFGHLGFTGTCAWIHAQKRVGLVLLTNATKFYWYHKQALNQLRRSLGELVWSETK